MDPSDQQSTHLSEADLKDEVLIDLRGSDVTLISCEGAKFRVHQCILSLASPFFRGMFDLAKSSTPTVDIPMVETASVLETLIRFIYPTLPRAELVTIGQAKIVLEAAHKLELQCVEDDVRRHLCEMLSNEANPLRAWALAASLKEDTPRQSAMLRFLCVDDDQLPNMIDQALEELRNVSATDYAQLLKWRADTINEARAIRMTREERLCDHTDVQYDANYSRISTRPFTDICESGTNPFILWDHPSALVRAWMQSAIATSMRPKCSYCASLFNRPESVTHLFSQLRLVTNNAKGRAPFSSVDASAPANHTPNGENLKQIPTSRRRPRHLLVE
jgi:hypothetical protein